VFGTTLPDDDNLELANENIDSPLTQITPNLPGVLPGRQILPVPEDSQASEETRVITRFFAEYVLLLLITKVIRWNWLKPFLQC
jgi:hypothetical protein